MLRPCSKPSNAFLCKETRLQLPMRGLQDPTLPSSPSLPPSLYTGNSPFLSLQQAKIFPALRT